MNKVRRKVGRKEENRTKQENKKIFEVEDNKLDSTTKGSKQSLNDIVKDNPKVINGRRAVIKKRARQLLTKYDIVKNRKAFIDKTANEFLEKIDITSKVEKPENSNNNEQKTIDQDQNIDNREEVDGKTLMINGKKVKIVRKAKKQGLKTKNSSYKTNESKDNKIMKDKQDNRLRTKSVKTKEEKFEIQMTLPHPMFMKPRVSKSPIAKARNDSKVPFYTAFIQSRIQARKNKQPLSSNLL